MVIKIDKSRTLGIYLGKMVMAMAMGVNGLDRTIQSGTPWIAKLVNITVISLWFVVRKYL